MHLFSTRYAHSQLSQVLFKYSLRGLSNHFLCFSLHVLHRRVKTKEPASRILTPTLLIVFVMKVSWENFARKVIHEYF